VAPLVLATMTSQALLVVLAPTIAATGREIGATVAAVGQARTVTAAVAIAVSVPITARIGVIGIPRLLAAGSALTVTAVAAVAVSPGLGWFLAAHGLVGVAFACLLTAGFAGVAGFAAGERAWAIGQVAGANALAWIVVNPVAGVVTDWWSWRLAYGVPGLMAVAALLSSRAVVPVAAGARGFPLRLIAGDRSARQWVGSELLAFFAWTGLLTFVGAFFIQRFGVRESAVGWLLAAAAAAYMIASTRSAGLVARFARRRLVAAAAVIMAVLLLAMLDLAGLGVVLSAVVFCLIGLTAGVRTPAASGLGLDQLPGRAEAMMAVRTAVTQSGYLLGALAGGVVLAVADYAALGVLLAVGMLMSGLLVLGVRDPHDLRDRR
jgi:predicted MFS family arabinose efflux permease